MNPLDGPRLKIRRAKRQLDKLKAIDDAFRHAGQYKIVRAEVNPHTGNDVYRVSISAEPAPDIGVLIGEMAHNLRSALDGLVFQLARLNPEAKTIAPNRQFPIFLVGRTKILRPGRRKGLIPHFEGMQRADGRSMISDLLPKHQASIEALQPYKRGQGGRFSRLHLLREINNADKHRLLLVAGAIPAGAIIDGQLYGVGRNPVLKDGAKVGEAPRHMNMQAHLIPLIAFGNGVPAVYGKPVFFTFWGITDHVEKIIESFGPEFPASHHGHTFL